MQVHSPVSTDMKRKAEQLGIEVSPDATVGEVRLLINERTGIPGPRRIQPRQRQLAKRLGLEGAEHPYADCVYLDMLIQHALEKATKEALAANPAFKTGVRIEIGNQTYRLSRVGNSQPA